MKQTKYLEVLNCGQKIKNLFKEQRNFMRKDDFASILNEPSMELLRASVDACELLKKVPSPFRTKTIVNNVIKDKDRAIRRISRWLGLKSKFNCSPSKVWGFICRDKRFEDTEFYNAVKEADMRFDLRRLKNFYVIYQSS